jgi:hypothetical protein
MESLDSKVKGLIETQQRILHAKFNRDNRERPFDFGNAKGVRARDGFGGEEAKMGKDELIRLYKGFETG